MTLVRRLLVLSILAPVAMLAGCTRGGGSGGGSSVAPVQTQKQPPATTANHLVLSGGSNQVAADLLVTDPSPAGTRAKFGIGAFDQSYTLTTPANAPFSFTLTAFDPTATGTVSLRFDLVTTPASQGMAMTPMLDFVFGGVTPRASNLAIGALWVETRGDGFAKADFSGTLNRSQSVILYVEREDSKGTKTHAVISIAVGPSSTINSPPATATSLYAGILATTPILSSDGPLFGLPAIAGNADRLTLVCYDSSPAGSVANGNPNCFGDFTRIERHLQLDPASSTVTMGSSPAAGNDCGNWRDLEITGLYNVIAIAQTGGDGLNVSFSFDRGGTFVQTLTLGAGRATKLPKIFMAPDYSVGLVYWDSDGQNQQRLVLVEGKPDTWDANNSPASYALRPPAVLLTLDASSPANFGTVPLVPDIKYTSAGDAFVAYGYSSEDFTNNQEGWNTATMKTHIGVQVRLAGATAFTDNTVDDMKEVVPSDPSLSLVGAGTATQVYIAYDGGNGAMGRGASASGVVLRKSSDAGTTFPTVVNLGTQAAYAPRVFARTSATGTVTVDCIFLDQDAIGPDLVIFHSDAGLANGTLGALVSAKKVPGTSKTAGNGSFMPVCPGGGGDTVEGMSWFGFDAVELGGKLYVAAHVSQSYFYQGGPLMMGGPARGGVATLAAPATPPAVLYPGMTQTPPSYDATAVNKLTVLTLQ